MSETVIETTGLTKVYGSQISVDHINLHVRRGTIYGLLGRNGAGKTTLVKLICGFYHPTEGEILLNGIPAQEFNREEWYSLMAVLFQDFTFPALTLDENLTGQEPGEIDRERIGKALDFSGFREVYERLPEKGKTPLVRGNQRKNSTDFSGGERQKMLFARTL